ncbi:amidase family protein [Streptomyces sp. NPDC093260]|uniref:amidase family protein n=1 Tax=Streptomyces sp. NPDC093260 TaxID=3155073 RepID=UPI0034236F73
MTPPHLWTVTQARAAMHQGDISAAEYLAELTGHRTHLAELCAFLPSTDTVPPAESRLRGPLGGIPLAVKDNIDVAGIPTTACTPALRHHSPRRHSAVWQRCAEAGAGLMGKTTMHELAYGVTGAHTDRLTARNPAHRDRLAGGSSSGTAAAVAAGIVPAGLGTDTGGSVRIPAALCGVAGFRPSTGRYPGRGVVPVSPTRDTVGVIARGVDDLRLFDAVLCGALVPVTPPPFPAPPVLAMPRATAWTDLDPEVARAAEAACDVLRAAGWTLRDLPEPLYDPAELLGAALAVPLAETRTALEDYLRGHGSPLTCETVLQSIASPDVRAVLTPLLHGPVIDPGRRRAAREVARRTAQAARRALRRSGAAAFLSPTTVTSAPPLGTGSWVRVGSRQVETFTTYIRNTAPASVWGWPSLTLPAGRTGAGLPVGLLLDAPRHHDRHLLDLGRRCERHLAAVRLAAPEIP